MKLNVFAILVISMAVLLVQNNFAQDRMNCRKDRNQYQMFQKLSLTETQQDQIVNLRLNHQMEMIDLKANLQKKKLEMTELKNNGNYTREDFINKVEAINSVKDEIAISKANFQMDIYQLLDDNQKKEWNKCSFNFGDMKEKRNKRNYDRSKN
jgi:Spy/CpxP family protein refolding chaperone